MYSVCLNDLVALAIGCSLYHNRWDFSPLIFTDIKCVCVMDQVSSRYVYIAIVKELQIPEIMSY
jgi:hypothetical protein